MSFIQEPEGLQVGQLLPGQGARAHLRLCRHHRHHQHGRRRLPGRRAHAQDAGARHGQAHVGGQAVVHPPLRHGARARRAGTTLISAVARF